MESQLSKYRQMETLGKSQVELIVQVYDGALVAFATAREAVDHKEFGHAYEALEKARKLLVHLYMTLDFDRGGAIAGHLGKLYAFLINQIDFIQATKDVERIESCITVLQNLRSGWADLGKQSSVPATLAEASEGSIAEAAVNMSV